VAFFAELVLAMSLSLATGGQAESPPRQTLIKRKTARKNALLLRGL
jgi:hypothetical protein